jgi:hypothetical protein
VRKLNNFLPLTGNFLVAYAGNSYQVGQDYIFFLPGLGLVDNNNVTAFSFSNKRLPAINITGLHRKSLLKWERR